MPTTAMMIESLIQMRHDPGGVPVDQFWTLVERFRADLVNQALAVLGNQNDAEDAAQESLCKAFLELNRLRDPAKLGHWLRSINRCQALDVLRKRRRAREQRLATGQVDTIQAAQAPQAAPARPPQGDAVVRAVDALPEYFREVVVLRYWEKLSTEAIAVQLGVPAGTVRSRLTRADGMLARALRIAERREGNA